MRIISRAFFCMPPTYQISSAAAGAQIAPALVRNDDASPPHSKLANLTHPLFRRLGIDRSHIKYANTWASSAILVQTLVCRSNSLGLRSIAEGVATEEQLELLSATGCDLAQGYYLARPACVDQFAASLSRNLQPVRRLSSQFDATPRGSA